MSKFLSKKTLIAAASAMAVFSFVPGRVFAQDPQANDKLPGVEAESDTESEAVESDDTQEFSLRSPNAPDPELQRTITIVSNEWDYDLCPHTAGYASEAQVLTGLYEGLFTYNPYSVEAVPAICSEYKTSRDKKRWTFTLRQDARFSNGEPITAQTIKDSWMSMLMNPDSTFASMIECISGVSEFLNGTGTAEDIKISVKDDFTLVVHLDTPIQHLPQILCHHAFCAYSGEENVYSGPFVLTSYQDGVIEMEKNPMYYDAAHVYVPGIKILLTDDADEAVYMFNTGSADWLTKNIALDSLIDQNSFKISTEFGTQYYFFKSNGSVWDKKEFRRALIEAVPYDKLRDGEYIPATTLVYPLSGYPDVIGFDDYDTDDAIEMMNAAREQNGIPLDQKLSLTIAVSSGNTYERLNAELLKSAWAPLGVSVKIQAKPNGKYIASIPTWDADLFLYGWIGDYADPMAFLDLFRGGSSLNIGGYRNSEYDALLKLAEEAESTSLHYKYLSQAEQILIDEGEVIPISHFVSQNVINTEEIGGWFKNALDIHPLKYLYFKPLQSTLENVVLAFPRLNQNCSSVN